MPVTPKSLKWWYLLQPCKVVGAWWSRHGTPTQIKMEIWNFSTGREHHLVLEGCSEWRSTEVNTWTVLTAITLIPILFLKTPKLLKPCLDTTTLQSDEDPGTSDLRVYSFSLPLEQNLHIQVVGPLTPRTRQNLDLLFKGWTFGSVTFEKNTKFKGAATSYDPKICQKKVEG